MSATPYTLVLGLGVTGASVVRHLCRRAAGGGERVVAMDSRAAPPFAATLAAEFPALELHLGGFDAAVLAGARRIVASPGIADLDAITADARARGVAVLSDIDLFAELARAPVIGITGTNGKSTVTVLVGELLAAAGVRVAVGGNLGTPALDLLADDVECYVLELSSFQLERSRPLALAAATILNITPDHLDLHGDMAAYSRAKARILAATAHVVVNRDAPETHALVPAGVPVTRFGLGRPGPDDFGLREHRGATWLAHGATPRRSPSPGSPVPIPPPWRRRCGTTSRCRTGWPSCRRRTASAGSTTPRPRTWVLPRPASAASTARWC
jgi:UDP-N-acetylmuramoylalanine--D-glutamate ligase